MKAIRSLPDPNRKLLYLTFDDGPCPGATQPVLDLLDRHGVRATFFLIGEKARQEPALVREIRSRGHAIGNHSRDHRWSRYFLGKRALRDWVSGAEGMLSDLLGEATIGFRPPAGVRTPELHAALRELGMPLILWNTRFFDAVFRWGRRRALKSLERARSGDIILLHDRQQLARLPMFLETLDAYVSAAKQAGFEFAALTQERVRKECP